MADENEQIKPPPAEDNPWYNFMQKSIELDGTDFPRGHHWFWGLYSLYENVTKFPEINLKALQNKLPDGHWLKKIETDETGFIPDSELGKISTKAVQTDELCALHDYLNKIEYPKDIDFSGLLFENKINFSNLIFPVDVIFSTSNFSAQVNFQGTIFSAKADFQGTIFSAKADFQYTVFSAQADFRNTTFSGDATFTNTQFCDTASFKMAKFYSNTVFLKSEFLKMAEFYGATFTNIISFREAKFSNAALFNNVKFLSSNTDFHDTEFFKMVFFSNAEFSGYPYFHNAKFLKYTSFKKTKFEHHAPRFYGAKFNNEMVWTGINLPKFKKIDDKETTIEYNERIQSNQNAYENLATKLDNQKKYHDQHLFFRAETRCRQELAESFFSFCAFWLYELFSDYGYRIGRVFGWWLVHIVFGALLIAFIASVCGDVRFHQNLPCAISVSVANANPYVFFGFESSSLKECYKILEPLAPISFAIVKAIQTTFGIALLSLLIITLRVRFRLK